MQRKKKWFCSDIVYRYTYSDCNVTYYDKHAAMVFTRAAGQMGISNLTGKCLENVKQWSVSDHLLECNFSIHFNNFDIQASDPNKFRLLIKENKTTKSFPLKLFGWNLFL